MSVAERGASLYPQLIVEDLDGLERVLGVGKSAGPLVEALLSGRRAGRGECFSPAQLRLTGSYDAVLYLGEHHRLAAEEGIERARALWQELLDHCGRVLLLGAGGLRDGAPGRSEAKKLLHREHDLLLSVGPRLRKLEEVAVPAHPGGAPVRVWRLWLHPSGSEFDVKARGAQFYGQKYSSRDRWEVVERLGRNNYAPDGNLVPLGASRSEEGSDVWAGTDFHVLREVRTGERAFGKKLKSDPVGQMREFSLLESVEHPRLVRVIEVHRDYGLILPYLPWRSLRTVVFAAIANRAEFRDEIVRFFTFSRECRVRTGIMDPRPGSGPETERRLDELVDLNIHNFLVKVEDGRVVDWRAVDLGVCWRDRTARNRSNLKKILRHIEGPGWLARLRRWIRGRGAPT